jgi:glycerol-3-phosphate acyltransferase PlsY
MFLLTQSGIVLASYVLGCISVGYYLVRWQTGQDLREMGSGATGGRNTGRVLGKSGAIATGLGDILKGVIATGAARWLALDPWALALVMIAVLAGHVWPFQLGFKGGKGLSAAFGAVLAFDYRVALLTALLAITLLFISRRSEFLFLMGIASSPIIAIALGHRWEVVAGMVILVLIILYAHRENIRKSLRSR